MYPPPQSHTHPYDRRMRLSDQALSFAGHIVGESEGSFSIKSESKMPLNPNENLVHMK